MVDKYELLKNINTYIVLLQQEARQNAKLTPTEKNGLKEFANNLDRVFEGDDVTIDLIKQKISDINLDRLSGKLSDGFKEFDTQLRIDIENYSSSWRARR